MVMLKEKRKLVNKMLASGTSFEELGLRIEIEDTKKISDYGVELKLLTKKGGSN